MLPDDHVEPGGALLQDTAVVVKASSFSRGQRSNEVGSLSAIAVTRWQIPADLHSFGEMDYKPCKAQSKAK